jgi:hypothetical protein
MHNKTVIVILAVAALLVGFIFLFERGSMTTSEKMARKGRVFTEFRKDAVSRLEITRQGQSPVVVERDMIQKELDEERWDITAPRELKADDTEVRQVLSAIDYLLADRAVQGKDKTTDPALGLAKPRLEAAFTIGGKTTTFRIGGDARGEKVYLATDSAPDTVYAVNADFLESLDKGLNDLRDKKLVAAELKTADSIRLKRAEDTVALKKRDAADWEVKVGGTFVLAASDQVRDLTSAVQDLEADEFIEDDVKKASFGKYGLDAPAVSIELGLGEDKFVTVSVGKACPGEKKRRYAMASGANTVACVSDDILQVAERPLLRFEETRPAVFNADDVVKVALAGGGDTLELEREDEKWRAVSKKVDIDSDAVDRLLKSITETRATAVDAGEAATSALGEVRGKATFTLADNMGEAALEWFDGADDASIRMRRDAEPAVLTVPKALAEALQPNILAFRAKTIENGDENDATALTITGPAAQTLARKDGLWTVLKPFGVAADVTAARTLAGLVSEVKVDEFVAQKASAEHGLTPPWATVTLTLETVDGDAKGEEKSGDEAKKTVKKELTLELGAKTDLGRRFARLRGADPVVFTVGDAYENAVSRPLIARDLLQIDDVDLRTLSLATPARMLNLIKSLDTWKAEDDTPVDTDTLKRLIADLGGVKTVSAVSFGPEDPAFGEPLLTIKATAGKDGEETTIKTLTVGAKSPDPAEDGYFARTDGIDATFVLPARLVNDLLAFVNPK